MSRSPLVRLVVLWASVLLCAARVCFAVNPLDVWHLRNPVLQTEGCRDITYGGGLFVTVGDFGRIWISPSGQNWTECATPTLSNLYAVKYANGLYIAVGDLGTILASTNAVDWEAQDSASFYDLRGVDFGNGVFVAVGTESQIQVSNNGTSWREVLRGTSDLLDVTFGMGRFVAVGNGKILTSTNGTQWFSAISSPKYKLQTVAFGGNKFLCSGFSTYDYTGVLGVSTDGTQWIYQSINGYYDTLVFTGSMWAGASGGAINVSLNGWDWTVAYSAEGEIKCLATDGKGLIGGGYKGLNVSSVDGSSWTNLSSKTGDEFAKIIYGSDKFVAVGYRGLFISTNGILWEKKLNTAYWIFDVAYGNGMFLAVGYDNLVFTSPDAEVWTAVSPTTTNFHYRSVAYASGRFVVATDSGTFLTTSNTSSWFLADSGRPTYSSIAYGNGMFAVVSGDSHALLTSVDGVVWQTHASLNDSTIGFAFGFGGFYALTYAGLFRTTDGNSWSFVTNTGSLSISCAHDTLILGGKSSFISTNGTDFVEHSLGDFSEYAAPYEVTFRSFAYGNDSFVGVGSQGLIVQSDPLASHPPLLTSQTTNQTLLAGDSVTLSTQFNGTSPIYFQWFKNGQPLFGGENSTLFASHLQTNDSGIYTLVASNSFGSITSAPIVLTVKSSVPALSIQTFAGVVIDGVAGRNYRVDYTSALNSSINWQPLTNFTLPWTPFTWIDVQSGTVPKRFYRAVYQP
jgi:hypothetical protein